MASDDATELSGKRIVVVEDDYLLATEICRELRDLGATVLGPAPTPFYAMQLINRRRIDAAVLDIRLHGAMVFEIADLLKVKGVPIVFATAFDRGDLPGRFQGMPLLAKPLDHSRLAAKLGEVTRRSVDQPINIPQRPVVPAGQWTPVQTFARALASQLSDI